MVLADRDKTNPDASVEPDEMAQYGITRVPVDYYCLGPYRYTNLKDAVAQAKRQQRSD